VGAELREIPHGGVIEMTDLATKPDPLPDIDVDVVESAAEPDRTPEPTLITTHEVLLGSAAALASPKVRRSYLAMVRAAFISGARTDRTGELVAPRHYPRHHAFIEHALMSRMMDRL
jgi:hypothetical protein